MTRTERLGIVCAAFVAIALGVGGATLLHRVSAAPDAGAPAPAPPSLSTAERRAVATPASAPPIRPDVGGGRAAIVVAGDAGARYRDAATRAKAARVRVVSALGAQLWAVERVAASRAAVEQAEARLRAVSADAGDAGAVAAAAARRAARARENAAFSALSAIANRFNQEGDDARAAAALSAWEAKRGETAPAAADRRAIAAAQSAAAAGRALSVARANWVAARRDVDYLRRATPPFLEARRLAERRAAAARAVFDASAAEAERRVAAR